MPPSRTSRLSWKVPVCAMFMALFVTGIVFFLIRVAGSHGQSGFVAPNSEFAKFSHNRSVVKSDSANRISCLLGNFRCNTSQTCISLDSRCDGVVDCPDAEDEQYCVCAFRMPPAKFCDKYPDCFDQSDENFCSYCPMNSFNCENGQCIPRNHVCDSKIDCRNAMDENFCFRLSTNIPIASVENDTPAMLKTGFLLRNQGGIWYPVCSNPYDAMQDALASHACVSITANPLASSTHQHRSFANVQGYLNKSGMEYMYHYYGRFVHWNGCLTDQGIFVTCNDVLCGFNPKLLLPHPRRQVRIVGGQNSEPGAWPWHGAVYKNGTYSCGATLISNRWLVSAGHCFLNHWRNYYEVQLGMLRRRSFTPHQKVYRISHVIQHPSFSIITLDYDIALLKTAEPVTFGFWVRPICLPDPPKVEKFGSICTAIGWGDTGEKADDSDNLQEVHIPLTVCRKSDRWLCAGFFEGGHDACQGDSGGPLMCLKDDGMSWYIAGVISTGIGCARPRTPGRYTRVSYFTSWMREVMTSTNYGVAPLSKCPGWRCSALGGGGCLPPKRICDGNVDCYDAQDEVKCKKGRKVKFYNS